MSKHVDYLVLGAGPAGLQMAYYLEKAGRQWLALEARDGAPGRRRNHRHARRHL